jgi:3-oxoacyl-[acyl-carrier-protein] synthase II
MGLERRVVITGLGTVGPQGRNVSEYWENIKAGRSSIRDVTGSHPYMKKYKVKVGALFDGDFEIDHSKINYERRGLTWKDAGRDRVCPNGLMALEAASEAIDDSGFLDDPSAGHRAGVCVGPGFGGLYDLEAGVRKMMIYGMGKVLPRYIDGNASVSDITGMLNNDDVMAEILSVGMARIDPKLAKRTLPGDPSVTIARFNGLHGPATAKVTACASGLDNVWDGVMYIQSGMTDIMVTGGAQEVSPLIVSGFGNARALTTNPDPLTACRPFDRDRDGFVLGEGGSILVLEELERAKARGANIYAEITGMGIKGDAGHVTAPREDCLYSSFAMMNALDMAGLNPSDIDYINAHGTSTVLNDMIESRTIKMVFGDDTKIPVSSTKSMTGHKLNETGAGELMTAVLSVRDGVIHPTVNCDNPDTKRDCTLDYVQGSARETPVRHAIINKAAFGGRSSTMAISRYDGD